MSIFNNIALCSDLQIMAVMELGKLLIIYSTLRQGEHRDPGFL